MPQLAGTGGRQTNRDALNRELEAVFATRSSAEWIEVLRVIDVLCAPINDYPALVDDPQVRHNALIASAVNSQGRAIPLIRNPISIDDSTPRLIAPPRLGGRRCPRSFTPSWAWTMSACRGSLAPARHLSRAPPIAQLTDQRRCPLGEPVIVDAVRTPFGKRGGAFRELRPDTLLAGILTDLVERSGVDPAAVEDVIAGCVSRRENRPPTWRGSPGSSRDCRRAPRRSRSTGCAARGRRP